MPPSGSAIFEHVRVPSRELTNILTQSPLLVQIPVSILVVRDDITYFHFQILLVVCFYTVVERINM